MPRGRPPAWPPKIEPRGGQDTVRVLTLDGSRRRLTLGPAGSTEAREAYTRLVAEMEANGRRYAERSAATTVTQLCLAYFSYCQQRYEGSQIRRVQRALKGVRALYGTTVAEEFSAKGLKTVRARWTQEGLARTYINSLVGVVVACWSWGISEDMVTEAPLVRLRTVRGLGRNDPGAIEPEDVRPCDPSAVAALLPHLSPTLQGMVRLQLLTGCRPGEAAAIRPADIARGWRVIDGKEVWLYTLDKHKSAWRGKPRMIPLVPAAQEVLAPFLEGREPHAYLFQPAESMAWFRAQQRAARKSKVQPSQVRRAEEAAKRAHRRVRPPGIRYTPASYARAIARACELHKVEPWSPGQLRHLVATQIETILGREDSQAVLGHDSPATTARYAESAERAARALLKAK